MKKWMTAILLAGAIGLPVTASAAQWPEGTSASKPYAGVPEVDLSTTMGYTMLYPRDKMPAEHFCDILEIYLPREDVVLGEGTVRVFDENGEFAVIDCSDPEQAKVRPLEEDELAGLKWGGGVCLEFHLPVSLNMGGNYYVNMDAGCFTAANGAVASLAIDRDSIWAPVVTGDYGINRLYYSQGTPPAPEGETEDLFASDVDENETEPEEEENPEYKIQPEVGDNIRFDLVMGGDAVSAVLYSENGSVQFEKMEYTESGKVRGTVTGADVNWGILFLNENGDVLSMLQM